MTGYIGDINHRSSMEARRNSSSRTVTKHTQYCTVKAAESNIIISDPSFVGQLVEGGSRTRKMYHGKAKAGEKGKRERLREEDGSDSRLVYLSSRCTYYSADVLSKISQSEEARLHKRIIP